MFIFTSAPLRKYRICRKIIDNLPNLVKSVKKLDFQVPQCLVLRFSLLLFLFGLLVPIFEISYINCVTKTVKLTTALGIIYSFAFSGVSHADKGSMSQKTQRRSSCMIKRVMHFFLFLLLLSLTACGRQNFSDILSQREIERFYLSPEFNDNFGFDTEAFIVTEGRKDRLLVVPHSTDFSKLIPSHEIEGYALFIDRARQTSGKDIVNFADDKRYTIYSYDGKSEDFNVSAKEPDAYFSRYSFLQSRNDSFTEESISDIIIDLDKDGAQHEMRLSSVWFYLPQSLLKKIGYRLVPNIELDGINTAGASVYVVDSEGTESAFVSGSTV